MPLQASRSLHPDYQGPVRFGFFYSKITADPTLENGHLQVLYGSELGVIGTEIAGTRLAMCLNGYCLIVDFPPVVAGFHFELGESSSMQLWPVRRPAGVAGLNFKGPARVDRVLLALCQAITVQMDTAALRA